MFLNLILFFGNILLISFCLTFINFLYTDVKGIDKLKEKVKQDKTKHKLTYKEQLAYISNVQEVDRKQFNTFGFKVLFFVVAITMALFIRIEPFILFGIKLNMFYIIPIILVLNYIQTYLLKKIGVDI